MKLALAMILLVGCSKKADDAKPWIPDPNAPATMTNTEIKRGQDACTAYVTKICACADTPAGKAKPELAKQCALAKGYPEALEAGLNVALGSDTEKQDVVSTSSVVRKTIAKCIEETAKLPSLGC